MQHSGNQEKYIVDSRGMITVVFDAGDDVFRVDIGYPTWKPGSIVMLDAEAKAEILNGLFDYGHTGVPPTLGSDKSRV